MFCDRCGSMLFPSDSGLACKHCKPKTFKDKGNKAKAKKRRKTNTSNEQEKKIYEAHEKGMSSVAAAKYSGSSPTTVQRRWGEEGLKFTHKTELSKDQYEKMIEAIHNGMNDCAAAKYAGTHRTTVRRHRKRLAKEKSSKLVRIVEQIYDGIVFAELGELELLSNLAPNKKTEEVLKECISDIEGGVYIRFSCGSEEYRKSCYIYGDKSNLDITMYLALNDVPCEDSTLCTAVKLLYRGRKPQNACIFRGSYSKIKRAKRLLESMK